MKVLIIRVVDDFQHGWEWEVEGVVGKERVGQDCRGIGYMLQLHHLCPTQNRWKGFRKEHWGSGKPLLKKLGLEQFLPSFPLDHKFCTHWHSQDNQGT